MSSNTPATGRLHRALPELYALTPIEEFPARALALVNALIGCDKSDYAEVDTALGASSTSWSSPSRRSCAP